MQYIFFKNILEAILSNYTCPECHNKVNEQSLQITGISSRGVDILVHCHTCGAHSQLNAEINTIAAQMFESQSGIKQFEDFIAQGGTMGVILQNKSTSNQKSSDNTIKDEDIIKIHNDLKNAKSIEDFMNE